MRATPRRTRTGLRAVTTVVLLGLGVVLPSPAASAADADTTPPTAPADPRTSDLTCTGVTFSWSASSDDVGVAFYDIYHDGQLMTSVPGTALSAELTAAPGATWGLYVNARDAAGNVFLVCLLVFVC